MIFKVITIDKTEFGKNFLNMQFNTNINH